MTKEVIAMAREAGATPYTNRHYPDRPTHTFNVEQLERFATLVGNAALEECLEIADQCADADMHASMAANAIRAMKEPTT